MGNSKKKRKTKRNRKIGYNSLGMLAIALVVLVLLGGLMLESKNLEERLAMYEARAADLEQDIEDETARTQEIERLKEYMQTDEYAEQAAREKLGLVKDNEIIFQEAN